MFEWLEREILEIKTPRFHEVDGPADAKLREAVQQSPMPLPGSYKEFVLRFGNANLYRRSRNGYNLCIFAGPRKATLNDGTEIYHIGVNDGASVYVKPESNFNELPIFEFEDGSEEQVSEGFEEWAIDNCAHARSLFGKKKWAEILRGPEPFSAEEEKAIETRRLIKWRVLGIDMDGNHILEVSNAGICKLPVLTLGVRSKNGRLNGAIRLNIRNLSPGQTTTLHADCYKTLVLPKEIELFSLPDPKPEDREFYDELEKIN